MIAYDFTLDIIKAPTKPYARASWNMPEKPTALIKWEDIVENSKTLGTIISVQEKINYRHYNILIMINTSITELQALQY